MGDQGLADRFSQLDRHRIADETTDSLTVNRLAAFDELVALRKALKDRAFPDRYRPALGRMTEPPVPEPKILRSDRGRGLIPLHATVDAGISLSSLLLVARRDESTIPIAPRTAWLGSFDPLEIEG